jgi:glycosyltransferase involved in cell wall biosynthesis
MAYRISIAAASHIPAILNANLALSPCVASGAIEMHVVKNAPSAAVAYNEALDASNADIVVFAHHDVYLPAGWDRLLVARLASVWNSHPNWAVLGAFGIGLDGAHLGPVWSSSLGMIVGRVPLLPVPVQSFDEMLIVLRRDSNLRFDEALPGWHMYGTDIAQNARAAKRDALAVGLPCIHNDAYHKVLGDDFTASYRFMQRKWGDVLPLRTPITKISRSGLHLLRDNWRNRKSVAFRAAMSIGTAEDPRHLAALCGWADLSACAS